MRKRKTPVTQFYFARDTLRLMVMSRKKTLRLVHVYERPDDAEISVKKQQHNIACVFKRNKGIAIKFRIKILLNIYLKQKSNSIKLKI